MFIGAVGDIEVEMTNDIADKDIGEEFQDRTPSLQRCMAYSPGFDDLMIPFLRDSMY